MIPCPMQGSGMIPSVGALNEWPEPARFICQVERNLSASWTAAVVTWTGMSTPSRKTIRHRFAGWHQLYLHRVGGR